KLQSDVYDKVKQSCLEDFQRSSPEIHKIMAIGEKLSQSQENVEQERKGLLDLESKINEKTDYVKSKIAEIDKLIEQAKNMPEVSVDDVLCGTTIVYNQYESFQLLDFCIFPR
ncbi:15144_t:CDS:1, partial [Acaulospora morrowiae]